MTPRPVRDNNPGDMDSGPAWQGLMPVNQMTPEQRAEPRFCVFIDPQHGFRALAMQLVIYQVAHGCKTIRQFITRWAPPGGADQNNTEAYIQHVVSGTATGADVPVSVRSRTFLFALCKAIATQETGAWAPYWTDAQLNAGLDLLPAGTFGAADHSMMKLGRAPKKVDPRHFEFASFLPIALPIIPASADWGSKVADWKVMLNDSEGCCTCSAVGHAILAFTTDNGSPFCPADADIQATYIRVTGEEGAAFDPATGANDNGCAITDVLNDYRKTGMAGHKLGAYAGVQFAPDVGLNIDHLRLGVAMFGVVDLGVNLPIFAQTQDVWDVPAGTALTGDWASGSWGGHSIIAVSYRAVDDTFGIVTWGALKTVTKAWLLAYCDEAEVLLSPDWISGDKVAPSGFDMAKLQADLAAL